MRLWYPQRRMRTHSHLTSTFRAYLDDSSESGRLRCVRVSVCRPVRRARDTRPITCCELPARPTKPERGAAYLNTTSSVV